MSAYPRLLGDIGGTHVRLALQVEAGAPIVGVRTLALADHADLEAAIRAYLRLEGASGLQPVTACLGVAAPVLGDHVQMINAPWSFSVDGLRQALGLRQLRCVNDFTALALALPALPEAELRQIGGEAPRPRMTKALLGAGTGLGVSGLVPTAGGGWVPLAGEGGHVSLPAANEAEEQLIGRLRARFGHVSAERVLSGSGLVLLYETHAALAQAAPERLSPADVAQRALAGSCPLCLAAVNSFCNWFGAIAANLAVTLGAQGGLYIGGGIVPKLGAFFEQSGFRQRFDDKGRYSAYLGAIPVFVIHSAYPALLGASLASLDA
jgi:glucokinase